MLMGLRWYVILLSRWDAESILRWAAETETPGPSYRG